jgi:hypothetical protein
MYEEIEMKLRATSSFGARVNLKNSAGAEKKKKKGTHKLHPLANDD